MLCRWENIERGEFRIVNSGMVAKLWATVKGNKTMNYEKFSRAMRYNHFKKEEKNHTIIFLSRYYYRNKIFAIVENKRLVYKFGVNASGWKPSNGCDDVNESNKSVCRKETRRRRCFQCLCIFPSVEIHKQHAEECSILLDIVEVNEKKDLQIINLDLQKIDSEDKDIKETDSDERAMEDENSENKDIEDREKEALETLMSLGQSTDVSSSTTLSNTISPAAVSTEITVSSTSSTSSTAEASVNQSSVVSTKQTLNVADKIQFMKTANEKSKTQTILQKRDSEPVGQSVQKQSEVDDDDDEIEILHEVIPGASQMKDKTPRLSQSIEEVVETVMNNQSEQANRIIQNLPSSPSIVINNKFINLITTSEEGKTKATEVRVNSKYQDLFTARGQQQQQQQQSTPVVIEAKKMLRLNQKLSNMIGGKKPQECSNIIEPSPGAESTLPETIDLEEPPCKIMKPNSSVPSITISQKYSTLSTTPTLANLLKTSSSDHKSSSPITTLKRRFPDSPTAAGPSNQASTVKTGELRAEQIPDLWKFMRSLLHNPNYNPKLLSWEDVEAGVFRIRDLRDFYIKWTELKGSQINYESLVKTIRLYDDLNILHNVEGQR